jgi:hypothetical protein
LLEGTSWTDFPETQQRDFLTTLIERIDIGADQIDIHFRPARLAALLDVAAPPLPSATEDETQILLVPIRLRRAGREITMRIDSTDPFATAKPNVRLIKLLIRARRFNATLLHSDDVPFAVLAKREGVSPSYFTRLVRLSYLAPDIAQAILDGRQPRDLTTDKLLAHSRLPSIRIVITRPARRSRIGTDRIWVSSSLALGNGAATSRSAPSHAGRKCMSI